jgi:hypothetical protein
MARIAEARSIANAAATAMLRILRPRCGDEKTRIGMLRSAAANLRHAARLVDEAHMELLANKAGLPADWTVSLDGMVTTYQDGIVPLEYAVVLADIVASRSKSVDWDKRAVAR